jgi:diphthamide biosynthesis protein 2
MPSLSSYPSLYSKHQVFSFNPISQTVRLESSQTNKLLMRRYAMVQKARDADVFGIIVGTLGVGKPCPPIRLPPPFLSKLRCAHRIASYLPLITYLRKLLTKKQKKSYTISVGKLNPAKLANFLEVECFVYVACVEGAIVVGDKVGVFFSLLFFLCFVWVIVA